MFMQIEIDQSGKIEQTHKPTVIAFSNHKTCGSIIISAREKQTLLREFRKIGKPKAFIYQTFNVLIFLLIRDHLKKLDRIIIDREYPSKDANLRDHIAIIFTKYHYKIDRSAIQFREIGKKSPAHLIAYNAAKKKKADINVSAKEILTVLLT